MSTPRWNPQDPAYGAPYAQGAGWGPAAPPHRPAPAAWAHSGSAVPGRHDGPELAGFGRRLTARAIDYVLAVVAAFVFFVIVVLLVAVLTGGSDTSDAQANVWALVFVFGWGLLLFFYDWLYLAAWGRTLGKMLVGIKVVSAADGGRLSQGQSLGRSALFGLPQSLPFLGHLFSLGESMAALGDQRQALHDRTAGTVVIRT
ncbi:RDD family protein [Nocardiopsis sp. EMB25]|uniref:RDD family protein n=1 Tax=Nocardiopsis TaxID=2013 RepID=UPI0003488FF3|nr:MULTISPECIES: RDD family protein [Nocardiopsis]MCY9787686.1 RDD family protein [Nocardiopsis sp. EMB25]